MYLKTTYVKALMSFTTKISDASSKQIICNDLYFLY